MVKGIDFFNQRRIKEVKKARFFRFIKVGSGVLLLSYILIILLTFSYLLYLRKENNNLNNQIIQKKKQIKKFNERESLQIILKQRLTALNKLLSQKRPNYNEILAFFENVVPSAGVTLDKIDIDQNGKINVSGMASTAEDFSNFLENLTEVNTKISFSKVTVSNISRSEAGNYSFKILFSGLENEKH